MIKKDDRTRGGQAVGATKPHENMEGMISCFHGM